VIATSTMLLASLTVTLAGYSLSRLPFRGKSALALAVLLLQTVPLSVTIVPIYDLMRRLELRNTYLGLILAHAVLGLPFLIWLMRDFFDTIPRAVEEAAWVDGASEPRTLFGVLLPAARGGVAVVAGYAFLTAWSEVLLALVLVDGSRLSTVALTFFESSGTDWPVVAAMATVYLLPVLAVFALVGRLIVGGLVTSAMGPE
jgi:ABC-type glycerol-3-phosphate transport system permease component